MFQSRLYPHPHHISSFSTVIVIVFCFVPQILLLVMNSGFYHPLVYLIVIITSPSTTITQ